MLWCHIASTLQRPHNFFINNFSGKLPLTVNHQLLIFVPLQIFTNQLVLLPSLLVLYLLHCVIILLVCMIKFLA